MKIYFYSGILILTWFILYPSFCRANNIIVVSIEPEIYFVRSIAGNNINVTVMVPKGADPHTYEPKPLQMRMLSQACAYLAIGVKFEQTWLPRFQEQNPNLKIFHLDQGIKKYPMEEQVFYPGPIKPHKNEFLDPHIWLGVDEAKLIAKNTYEALSKTFPDQKQLFKKRLNQLLSHLTTLKKTIARRLARLKNRNFLVFHPAWGYFARCFGLRQIAIQIRGREPSAKDMAWIVQVIKQHKIPILFIQPQFSPKKAQVIAKQLGIKVMLADPLSREWEKNILHLVDNLLLANTN
ncbi:MAG: zinc ABC transporter substrate-binding protein [Desulfonauticus sp.]|nr:zinc ABC transporter substrate-binding protein [Desulfonauticus sp.]